MSLFGKVKTMLFGTRRQEEKPSGSRDHISVDVSIALQRNERAGEKARAALEEMKMRDTLEALTGKMQ